VSVLLRGDQSAAPNGVALSTAGTRPDAGGVIELGLCSLL